MRRAALLFVLTRLALVAATALPWPAECLSFEVPSADDHARLQTKSPGWRRDASGALVRDARGRGFMVDATVPFLDAFARWDAAFYFEVAAVGYLKNEAGAIKETSGFLPGYALLVRVAAKALNAASGGSYAIPYDRPYVGLWAAFLVSNVFFFVALVGLRRLVSALTGDAATADRAAFWLCVAPTSFFFSAALSESVFLALSVASLFFAYRRRFLAAAVFGGLAAFTRPVGLFLVVPLLIATYERRTLTAQMAKDWFKFLLVPAGFAAALVVQWFDLEPAGRQALFEGRWSEIGRFDAYFKAQALFGHGTFPTLNGFTHLFSGTGKTRLAIARDIVQATGLVVALGCVVRLVRAARVNPFHWALAAWAVVSIAFPLLADDVISLPRYLAAIAPLYCGAALLLPGGRVGAALGVASFALQIAAFQLFARSWPVFI
jgi:hypothetical protein